MAIRHINAYTCNEVRALVLDSFGLGDGSAIVYEPKHPCGDWSETVVGPIHVYFAQ